MSAAQTAGVGVLFNGELDAFLGQHPEAVDFVSIIPERFWNDFGRDVDPRFVPLPDEVAILDALASRFQLVAHGVGLSIASASAFDTAHLRQLRRWQDRYGFAWISEHLAAVRVNTEATPDHHAGLALPLAWDDDLLAMLGERINQAQDILGMQLLLENGVVHTPVPDPDMTEPEFMNALAKSTGCGFLLDLHNLYVNSINLGLSAPDFIDALNLDDVREIHVAGGNRLYGVYLDSHAGACPQTVWELLAFTAPRCRRLRGVTFEFHESYYPTLGVDGVLEQVAMARQILSKEPATWQSSNSSVPSLI
jgi:uncharacterized protein (UPF0276 family)